MPGPGFSVAFAAALPAATSRRRTPPPGSGNMLMKRLLLCLALFPGIAPAALASIAAIVPLAIVAQTGTA